MRSSSICMLCLISLCPYPVSLQLFQYCSGWPGGGLEKLKIRLNSVKLIGVGAGTGNTQLFLEVIHPMEEGVSSKLQIQMYYELTATEENKRYLDAVPLFCVFCVSFPKEY